MLIHIHIVAQLLLLTEILTCDLFILCANIRNGVEQGCMTPQLRFFYWVIKPDSLSMVKENH